MLTLAKWMVAPMMAAGLMFFADAPDAEARGPFRVGGLSISIGGGGYGSHYGHGLHHGHGAHYGHYNSYRPAYRSYYAPQYRSYLPSRYGSHYGGSYLHRSGHYDYHPTEIVPHGNHYDVIPGHYDWHDTSHWHH